MVSVKRSELIDFSSDLFTLIRHFVFPNSPPRATGAEAVPEESRKKL